MLKFGIIPVEDSQYYRESLDQVTLAEALGFDSVWLEEHHGSGGHYHPCPLVYLAGYATRTERILLGTDIAVLPLYHPVRFAEEAAQLDVMSGGRLVLGLAVGYRDSEFAAYQVPMDGRGAQFEEMLQLIRRLWSEESVDSEGPLYKLQGFTLEPRPVQKPHPPVWVGGWGAPALRRAVTMAEAWVPGPTANLTKLKESQALYQANLAKHGVDPLSRPRPLTRDVIIAATQAEAEELAERYLLASYRDEYSGWHHPLIAAADPTSTQVLDELRQERFIIGSPEQVIEQIRCFQDALGMDHLICRLHFTGMPPKIVTSAIRLLGQEVLPAFKSSPSLKESRSTPPSSAEKGSGG